MDYVIQGIRYDGTIAELFRTGNVEEARRQFTTIAKHSYKQIKLIQELAVR